MITKSILSPFRLRGPQDPFSAQDTLPRNIRQVRAEKRFRSIAPNANPGGGSTSTIQKLTEVLGDKNDFIRENAILTLKQIKQEL